MTSISTLCGASSLPDSSQDDLRGQAGRRSHQPGLRKVQDPSSEASRPAGGHVLARPPDKRVHTDLEVK